MPGLTDKLADRIERHGPLTVGDYMAAALGDPEHGYYMTRDPLGAAGDFVTAPEISQMFGELVGLWCAEVWRASGAPDPIALVELGPGRGTLLADALRACRVVPDFLRAIRLHLVETSPRLRESQMATLSDAPLAAPPVWLDRFDAVADGPLLLIANEFFDALPIRQFERTADAWCERLVALGPDRRLSFTLGPPAPANRLLVPESLRDATPGTVAETCSPALGLVRDIAGRLHGHGGAALIVDYGYRQASGRPTLQALRGHASVDALENPGLADLTAHVDFAAIAAEAQAGGVAVHGPVSQGDFLMGLGIGTRAAMLSKNAGEARRREIASAVDRLTAPEAMGTLFKAMALAAQGGPTPPAFPEGSRDAD